MTGWVREKKLSTRLNPQSLSQKFNVGLSQLIQLEDLSYLNLELKV